MSILQFEDLPNELFAHIFVYFDLASVYQTFWGLNHRINQLLRSRKNLSLILERTHFPPWIEIIAEQITRLKITTCQSIDLSLFSNLFSLELSRANEQQIEQIRSDVLPHLTQLSLSTPFHLSLPSIVIEEIFSNAFVHLEHVKLTRLNPFPSSFHFQSPSLRSLRIISIDILVIPQILTICPNLLSLHVNFLGQNRHLPSSFQHHTLEEFLLEDSYHKLSFETINHLFDYIPHLRSLSLVCLSSGPFVDLVENLVDRCEDLDEFQCEILEAPNNDMVDLENIQIMKECFYNLQCVDKDNHHRLFFTE